MFLKKLFSMNADSIFQVVLNNPENYRLQIIYTQINRDRHNDPSFRHYYFNVDSKQYFNPASTVKLPLALLSLEKINHLKPHGLSAATTILFDSAFSGQTSKLTDSTSKNGLPSISHFIKKAFLVSDNDAYSRMYEFVGQSEINRRLHDMGYREIRITHRFVKMTPEQNRHTNPVRFVDENGTLIYSQPPAYNRDSFDFNRTEKIGNAYYDNNDSLVRGPMDFSRRNRLALYDLHQILLSTIFPESVPAKQRFNLTKEDYAFLYQYLSQYPGETNYPKYDSTQYYQSFVKFFFRDSLHRQVPEYIRVFNKVGWAYGFLIDASYVADFRNKIEFLLSASIYANSDGILNDDKYDFENIAHPFFYQLGQTIYQFELTRKRSFKPNLEKFMVPYEIRIRDGRLTVKDVDN